MDGRLGRNPLKGALEDALHAVLCGAGHNIRLLLKKLRLLLAQICQQLIAAMFAKTTPGCLNWKTELFSTDEVNNISWPMQTSLQKGIKPFLRLFFARELHSLFESLRKSQPDSKRVRQATIKLGLKVNFFQGKLCSKYLL